MADEHNTMSVSFPDVDENLYRDFKVAADKLGFTRTEAFERAMKLWMDSAEKFGEKKH